MFEYLGWIIAAILFTIAFVTHDWFELVPLGRRPRSVSRLVSKHLKLSSIDSLTIIERQFPFRVRADLQKTINELFALVIEDVDLVARDREKMSDSCEEAMLNRLLNEMDGLNEDAAILFILTTNRPEMLEAALAARPGRVDQAIEFPLPDHEGRRKLVQLYSSGVTLSETCVSEIVRRTDGVSTAFIKELMRRTIQYHIEREGEGAIDRNDVDNALDEMLFAGGTLNRQLLGAKKLAP